LVAQEQDIANIVAEIRSLHPRVERTIEALRARFNEGDKLVDESNQYASPDYWRLAGITDGMIKINIIIEKNFEYIETFAVLATTRYMLELLIWSRLLTSDDPEYCFTYVKWSITGNRDYLKEHLAKVNREIAFFEGLEDREAKDTLDAATRSLGVRNAGAGSPSAFSERFRMIAEENDRQARRRFCLYSRDAKTRGYGYQAALMKRQVVPQLEKEIERLEKIMEAALSQMPESSRGLKRWNWKEQATKAGMTEQYDYLYSYTSRLLHATPPGLATKQKNLELDEAVMFLEFIFVAILEATEIAERVGRIKNPEAH